MRVWLPSKRFWKRCAVGLGLLVATLLIVNAIFTWRLNRRLQAKLADIRAAGDPASIADLAPDPIPDDQNAAAILKALAPRLEEFSGELGEFLDTPSGKVLEWNEGHGRWPTPEQISAVNTILDKYSDIERGIAAASACEKYASLAVFGLESREYLAAVVQFPPTLVTASRYANWMMAVRISNDDADGAVDLGRQIIRLARLYESEPGLINYLVAQGAVSRVADGIHDALAQGPVSVKTRAALDEELAKCDDPLRLAKALRMERGISVSMTAESPQSHPAGFVSPVFQRVTGWAMTSHFVGALEVVDHQIGLAARPWFKVFAEHGGHQSGAPSSGRGGLAEVLHRSFRVAHLAQSRSIATMRALRISNGLSRYRAEHGREASGLADLALPKETTIDPFSGESLKMFLADDGWVIYSVLANGVDDGGYFGESLDDGVAPRGPRRAQQ